MLFIDSPSAATARAFTYLRTWFEDNNILLEDFFLFFSKIGQQRIIKSVLLNRVLIGGPIKKSWKKICIITSPNDLLRQHMIHHDKYQIKLLVIDIFAITYDFLLICNSLRWIEQFCMSQTYWDNLQFRWEMTILKDNFLEIFSWDLQMFNFDTDIKMQSDKLHRVFLSSKIMSKNRTLKLIGWVKFQSIILF